MTKNDFIIEEMRAEDVREACALWYSIPELGVAQSFDTPERIATYLEHNPGISSVARRGDRIVGAVMCGHDGRRGSFYHIGVLPEYRGQAIGRRLVEHSLLSLRKINITTAFCFTWSTNETAQAFWRKIGWEYCPDVQYHYLAFNMED